MNKPTIWAAVTSNLAIFATDARLHSSLWGYSWLAKAGWSEERRRGRRVSRRMRGWRATASSLDPCKLYSIPHPCTYIPFSYTNPNYSCEKRQMSGSSGRCGVEDPAAPIAPPSTPSYLTPILRLNRRMKGRSASRLSYRYEDRPESGTRQDDENKSKLDTTILRPDNASGEAAMCCPSCFGVSVPGD